MGKQNRNSGKKENRNEKVEIKGRNMDAKCNVNIVRNEETGIYEVTLGSPEEQYKGISTTNYYESFATAVKEEYLPNVSSENIKWFEKMVFSDVEFKDFIQEVKVGWSCLKRRYTSYETVGVVAWL